MNTRFCHGGGLLVGAGAEVGVAASEYYNKPMVEVLGCSRLVCTQCKACVRQGAGFAPQRAAFDAEVAYATEDWRALPWMNALGTPNTVRFYTCKCTQYLTSRALFLAPRDDDERSRPPWACSGHPVPALPFVFEGEWIEQSSDPDRLVDLALRGFPQPRYAHERTAIAALARLYTRLEGTSLRSRLAEAVGRRLTSIDLAARVSAVRFFAQCPHNEAWSAIGQVLQGDRSLFRDLQDPQAPAGTTLEDTLVAAVATRVRETFAGGNADREAAELLRCEATNGAPEAAFTALAETDLAWLLAQAPELLRRRPQAVYKLLISLGAMELANRGELAVQWVRDGVVGAAEVRRYIEHSYLPQRETLLEALHSATQRGEV